MSKKILVYLLVIALITVSGLPAFGESIYTMDFSLNKTDYSIDEYVTGTGIVYNSGVPTPNALVTMTVENEDGKSLYDVEQYTTNSQGKFNVRFRMVKSIENGTYNIKLKSNGVEKSVSFKITKEIPIIILESIAIVGSKNEIKVNDNLQLSLKGKMSDGSDATTKDLKDAQWSSSNNSIATVDSTGLVTGKGKGEAIITVKVGELQAAFKVRVTQESSPPDSGGDDSTPSKPKQPAEKEQKTSQGTAIIKTDDKGNIVTLLNVDKDKVSAQIKDNVDGIVTINAAVDPNASQISVNMNAELFSTASQNSTRLEINTGNATISIEPGTLSVADGAEVSLTTKALNEEEAKEILARVGSTEFNTAALVFDFDITSSKGAVRFNKPLTITIKYDTSKVIEPEKLGIYYFNNNTKEWEYIGGKVTRNGTIEFKVEHFSKYTAMEYRKTFNDISNVVWAQKQIEVLAARHIIKGIDSKNFAPNNNITRAEFAKLIVEGLSLKHGEKIVSFSDVKAGAWYKEFVEIAASLGIVTGHDGKFDPNGQITREQMATMIVRALKYIEPNGSYITGILNFTDYENISEWAKEAVEISVSKELVKGLGNGAFGPQEKATKAQAAVIIYRMLDVLDRL